MHDEKKVLFFDRAPLCTDPAPLSCDSDGASTISIHPSIHPSILSYSVQTKRTKPRNTVLGERPARARPRTAPAPLTS